MLWPALGLDPQQKPAAVPVSAMLMETGVGPVDGHVTAHRVAVRVFQSVGAQHSVPALRVRGLHDSPALVEPRQNIILAVIANTQRADLCRIRRFRHHTKRGADFGQGVLKLWIERSQFGYKIVPLEIHTSGNTEVSNGIDCAFVCVASLRYRENSRAEVSG